jgi:hypothetical protein
MPYTHFSEQRTFGSQVAGSSNADTQLDTLTTLQVSKKRLPKPVQMPKKRLCNCRKRGSQVIGNSALFLKKHR